MGVLVLFIHKLVHMEDVVINQRRFRSWQNGSWSKGICHEKQSDFDPRTHAKAEGEKPPPAAWPQTSICKLARMPKHIYYTHIPKEAF